MNNPRPIPAARFEGEVSTPYGKACRERDAIQAIRDGAYREWLRIVSDMHADIERVKRGGVN